MATAYPSAVPIRASGTVSPLGTATARKIDLEFLLLYTVQSSTPYTLQA